MLDLQALGPVDLHGDGDPVAVLAQPKRLALFAYLALARPRGFQRRDTLLGVFWPELDQSRARKALSQSLFFLRRALPEGVLVTRGAEEVGVSPGRVHRDVVAFERAIEEERWAEALALYRGDLLAGFHITDAPEFEHWLDVERERLREQAAGAAWALADQRIAEGELVEAERAAHRALLLAPTDESPVRDFIEALAAAGDRAAALRFYEKFERVLAEELEVEPGPETAAVAAAVRNGAASVARVPAPPVDGGTEPEVLGPAQVAPAAPHAAKAAGRPPRTERPDPLTPDGGDVSTATRRGWRPWLGAAIAAAGLVAGGVIVALAGADEGAVRARGVVPPRGIAVLPFENRTGDPSLDDLGRITADWITAGLTRIDTLRVVPPSSVGRSVSDGDGAGSIARIALRTGAGLFLTGSFVQVRDSLHLYAQLVGPSEEQVLESFGPERTHRNDPTAAVGALREQILGRVALRLDDRFMGLESVKGPRPPSYEAYRAYLTGVDLFFTGPYPAAIRELDRAWAADSTFVAPGIWVASAFGNMGDPARQDSVLQLLERRRSHLSPVERAGVDVMRAGLRGDREMVYRIVSEGLRRQPATEGRLITGGAALATNRPRAAIAALRSEPETGATRNRFLGFHNTLTEALHVLGRHEEELEAAREARVRLPERLRPFFLEARALIALHRLDEAQDVLEEAMARPGRDWSPGYLQLRAGLELRWHGQPEAAEQALRRGLEWYETVASDGDYRFSIGRAHLWLGKAESAARHFRELAARHSDNVEYLGYLGLAYAMARRSDAAREVDARLEAWDEPYIRGQHLYWRAAIAARLGQKDRAVSLLREAIARGVPYSQLHESEELRPLAHYPPFLELIAPKG
ncbi:MAG: BTAD domain-containing putative transcriptional regulator [Gemmatimonadota bacterium]